VTAPYGQVRPRTFEELVSWFERLQNGTLPFRKVHINGPLEHGIRPVTATLTEDGASDSTILADATGAAITVNLLTAMGRKGRELIVKRMNAGGNTVTVDAAGAETIDGALTVVLAAQYDRIRIQSDGANWVRVD
jgi:hypothetical protein